MSSLVSLFGCDSKFISLVFFILILILYQVVRSSALTDVQIEGMGRKIREFNVRELIRHPDEIKTLVKTLLKASIIKAHEIG